MSTNTLKCPKCGWKLNDDHFTDQEQLNADDETRICIVCTDAKPSSENKNNTTQSDEVESNDNEDDDLTSSTTTTNVKLYLNPDTNIWVPVEVMYVLRDVIPPPK